MFFNPSDTVRVHVLVGLCLRPPHGWILNSRMGVSWISDVLAESFGLRGFDITFVIYLCLLSLLDLWRGQSN